MNPVKQENTTNTTRDRKHAAEQLPPGRIPRDYYGFDHYVSKERMLTYWHQVNEILLHKPPRVLEIGVGNRIVSSIIRSFGVETVTADINPSLNPDVVTPISDLHRHFQEREFPFVLCARVLQHLPFAEFEPSLQQLHRVTGDYLLLTLPVETLRIYFRLRATGFNAKNFSIPLPLFLKRVIQRGRTRQQSGQQQNFWKIGQSRESAMTVIRRLLGRYFVIEKAYQVAEDMSHAFFIMKRR